MYYQAIVHEPKEFQTIEEAVSVIPNVSSYHALKIPLSDLVNLFIVNDAHIDDSSFSESAIILQKEDNLFYQIESLTKGKDNKHFIKMIKDAVTEYLTQNLKQPTQLILTQPTGKEKAWFNCGCCGDRFFDNVSDQLLYDQDNGYGICSACNRYY